MAKRYSSILETIGNTPVVRINRLAPAGVNLYVKVEAFNPLGSVKDRLALGVIEAAEKSGALKPGQTVIEATSGNTGIGLAMVCAAKGYPLVVTMAEPFSVERRKLMRFLGAKVIVTPAAERAVGMIKKMEELAAAHGWFMTRQFENEANPDYHSRTTAREIVDDFADAKLDYWVTGYGTGGTLKGVARVLRKESPEDQDHRLRAGGRAAARQQDRAGAQARRHARRAAPELQAASDAGLDAGLHPEADRRRGRHEGDRPPAAHPGARRHPLQQGSRRQGRHLRRHHLGRDLRRRAQGGRRGARRAPTSCACCPTRASAISARRCSPTCRRT